ncbi:MAG: hypothetical protein Q9168_006060 [Polycauliona sp. 1 TL-2023]
MPNPYPNALFSLLPLNPKAEAVTSHERNENAAYRISDANQAPKYALSIGFHNGSKARDAHTLAVIGRGGDVDIYIEGSSMSKVQCSFELDLDTKVVMLFDRSTAHTTQVYGESSTPFQHERLLPRKVVIDRGVNRYIGMGGAARNLIRFELEWHKSEFQTKATIESRKIPASYREESELDPRTAHTLSQEPDTELPSRMETRAHTPGQLRMRYKELDCLGKGNYGEVFKALNYDSGKFMAVKKLRIKDDRDLYLARKREVETLARIRHPHIIEFIHSEGWGTPVVSIFMELKDGSLGSLLKNKKALGSVQQFDKVTDTVLKQMLQALDFLACHQVIHRDVKPDNILYISTRSDKCGYRFQLGDFGLCNPYNNARSQTGTPIFAPPEYGSARQTPKFDVWSLMVTLLWAFNTNGFITKILQAQDQDRIIRTVLDFAAATKSELFASMAKLNPDERASAAQLLKDHFGGKGLTTRQDSPMPMEE